MRHSFSLVELSIVLVILGLLTGGILAGQSLIHAAELRSVSTEYGKYTGAFNTFRDKYMALPGDMANAQSFWLIQHATPTTCATQPSTDARTCNGNGDGTIRWWLGSDEPARAWQHLANAGLIEGRYTGVGIAPSASFAPRMRFSAGSNWYVTTWIAPFPGDTTTFATSAAGNALNVYDENTFVTFKPEDAWNLDTKMDDGRPQSGKLIGSKGSAALPCSTRYGQPVAAADATATYNLTSNVVSCDMFFHKAF